MAVQATVYESRQQQRYILDALKDCSDSKDLRTGKSMHALAIENGCDSNIYIASALVNMYSRCGALVEARIVFDRITSPTVVPWTTLISGYAKNGEGKTALQLYERMLREGPAPNARAFVAVLRACTVLASKEEGPLHVNSRKIVKENSLEMTMIVHSHAVSYGCEWDIFVTSILVDIYLKCGSTSDARNVFDNMKYRDVVCWNVMVMGCAENGEGLLALEVFSRMGREGCLPNALSFVAALKACTSLACKDECLEEILRRHDPSTCSRDKVEALDKGLGIHLQVEASSFLTDVRVVNTLMCMYAKCGSMVDAHAAFDGLIHPTVVSWTCLISGYAENGKGVLALELFSQMRREGHPQDAFVFVAALKACTALSSEEEGEKVNDKLVKVHSLEKGREVHSQVVENGCSSNIFVASTLVDMYAKCGSMELARQVFTEMRLPNVVAWNALILGYAENGEGWLALKLFSRMKAEGFAPDARTFMVALKACGTVGALDIGKSLHEEIVSCGLQQDALLAICLVDFYGKCGSVDDAQLVFDSVTKKDPIIWTALMTGYSSTGDCNRVFELFHGMRDAGLRPNDVTFNCILNTCSHAGLLDKGKEYFEDMSSKYGVNPDLVHYNCMIDILGRANDLENAMVLLKSMPFEPNVVTWKTILGACRKWKNEDLGSVAFQSLMKLDSSCSGHYLSMAGIFWSRYHTDYLRNHETAFEDTV